MAYPQLEYCSPNKGNISTKQYLPYDHKVNLLPFQGNLHEREAIINLPLFCFCVHSCTCFINGLNNKILGFSYFRIDRRIIDKHLDGIISAIGCDRKSCKCPKLTKRKENTEVSTQNSHSFNYLPLHSKLTIHINKNVK